MLALALVLLQAGSVFAADPPKVTVAYSTVIVDEGQWAYNHGGIELYGTYSVDLSPTVGDVTWEDGVWWEWDWDFMTSDGPTQSQIVYIDFVDANGTTTISFDLVVNNVAPVVDAGPDDTVYEGETFMGSGSFTDPGADTWTATVDYGDGSGMQPLSLSGKTFTLSHVYTEDGVYTVTVNVTDDDGGTGTDTLQVTVNDVPLTPAVPSMTEWGILVTVVGFATCFFLVLRRKFYKAG
jgi:hypothetical protein